MHVNLHANAATTYKVRAYIRRSSASVHLLALELGVSETTIRRWKQRTTVDDRSHTPHTIRSSLSAIEERLACELRTTVGLSLDDTLEVLQRCVNPKLSRSAVYRCLKRHGVAVLPKALKIKPQAFLTEAPAGFIHVDVKYLSALHGKRTYAYVAIDRATRFAYVEILEDRRGETAARFLERFLQAFPLQVHTLLTDNGSEFTDRFAVDKKDKPPDRPSGQHPFDRICKAHHIEHRLAKPFHPQTNGMVERFNRRLAERLEEPDLKRAGHRRRFFSHQERNDFLLTFVSNYNRTRLRCLSYQSPAEVLTNLTKHNTSAGMTEVKSPHPRFADPLPCKHGRGR